MTSTPQEFAEVAVSTRQIGPSRGLVSDSVRSIFHHRELCFFLIRRELKIRYAQTALGAAWMVFQPLGLMLVFMFAFRNIGSIQTDVPYPVFALAGLTLWTFVSGSVMRGANSLVSNADLFTKTNCPRLLIPLTTVLAGLVDFAIAFILFLVLSASLGVYPTWHFVFAPLFVGLALVAAMGISFLLAAINVRYRDVRTGLPVVIQLWLFLSPIAYPLTYRSQPWVALIDLNPLVGLINGFRWSVAGTPRPSAALLLVTVATCGLFLAAGLLRFARLERTFADEA